MDFWKAILGLTRRKLVIIPLVASTVAVALSGYFLTPLRYISSTTMVLVTPTLGGTISKDPSKPVDVTNPMLSFSNTLKTASSILIQAMNTREAAAELGAPKDGPNKLTIDDGRTNADLIDGNGPFVYVVCESTSPTQAKEVVVRAQQRMRLELVDRQKAMGAPPETYLTIVDVVAPTIPKVNRSDRLKVGGLALLASLVLGLSVAYAWERARAGRRRVADGELLPTLQDTELDSSRGQARDDDLHVAVDEWSSGEVAPTADTDATIRAYPVDDAADTDATTRAHPLDEAADTDATTRAHPLDEAADTDATTRAHPVDEAMLDVEHGALADEEHAVDEPAIDSEQQPDDDDHLPGAEQSVEPEHFVSGSEEERAKDVWDLYIAEYPPTEEISAHGSADDELDWSLDWRLDGLGSERGSAVVGPQRGGG
jgi:hypothetical protein